MRNLELLEKEYKEFIDRINEVNSRIAIAVDKTKEIKRYPNFAEEEGSPDYIYSTYDYDEYDHDAEDKGEVDVSDEEYWDLVDEAVEVRNKLFEEKFNINLEFNRWKYKNNITFEDFKETQRNYRVQSVKWRGWDSSDYVYESMIHSINLTDQDEINKIISGLRTITDKIIEYYEDNNDKYGFDYELLEWIDYLDIVNNETRFRRNPECNTTMALDIMENHYIYEPFEESFKECVMNICKHMDYEFIYMLERVETRGHELKWLE